MGAVAPDRRRLLRFGGLRRLGRGRLLRRCLRRGLRRRSLLRRCLRRGRRRLRLPRLRRRDRRRRLGERTVVVEVDRAATTGGRRLAEHLVELVLRGLLVDVQRERELRHEDLARTGEHALLTRGQALVLLADREVPDDLGHLVDVAALQLLDVVLEAARPVGRHARFLLAQHREDLFDLFVVDDVAETDLVGVVGRHLQGEVAVREPQDQVVLLLAERLHLLALLDGRRAVVGIDDLVTDIEGHEKAVLLRNREERTTHGTGVRSARSHPWVVCGPWPTGASSIRPSCSHPSRRRWSTGSAARRASASSPRATSCSPRGTNRRTSTWCRRGASPSPRGRRTTGSRWSR